MPYVPSSLDWSSAGPSLADFLATPTSPPCATASSISRPQGFFSPDDHVVRTPPYESRAQQSLTPGQASLLDALFSLGQPADDQETSPDQSEFSNQAALDSPPPDHDHIPVVPEDQANVTGVLIAPLSLDRRVQSNWVPFVLQSYSLWMARFLFEPLRITPLAREYVLGGYSLGPQARWRMTMASHVVREATTTTAYDLVRPPNIFLLQNQMQQDWQLVSSSRQPNLEIDRERALRSLDSIYELVSMLVKLTPLSNVLTAMQFAAPVFRRACPDPPQELVHLPGLLVSVNVSLQFYATLDILLSTLTGRPMFLRYNLDFKPPATEDIFNLENGPGFRWLYGVPDRLVVTLAKMNTLLEDFGAYVDLSIISELEEEILGFKSVVGVSADPTLTVGRLVVQECWRQAAFIYLYMGLCGADAHDARVVRAQSKFMDLVKGARPARNPDSFLIMPMIMLGIATCDAESQSYIRTRLLSLPECSRTATVGNDVVRILDDIWALERSARWSDLRLACLRVVGM